MRKEYYTENVKCKNGVVKPITKCKMVDDCPVCGQEMILVTHKKGTVAKRSIKRFECTNKDVY